MNDNVICLFSMISWSLLIFFHMRSLVSGAVIYIFNNSAYRKRKKGQNFGDWLFYLRFKSDMPKWLLIPYYIVLAFHTVAICIFVIFIAAKCPYDYCIVLAKVIVYSDLVCLFILLVLFWGKDGFNYSRWIKKRGQPPKKKNKF